MGGVGVDAAAVLGVDAHGGTFLGSYQRLTAANWIRYLTMVEIEFYYMTATNSGS